MIIAPILESTEQNNKIICNASCTSSFITWFLNQTLLSDIRHGIDYYIQSNRRSQCLTPTRDERSYTEMLQLNTSAVTMTTISCASHFICNQIEILNGSCTPNMCFSKPSQLNLTSNLNKYMLQ